MLKLTGFVFFLRSNLSLVGNSRAFYNMIYNVFVYGTLKRGEPNHNWLTNKENGTGEFICEGTTKEKYPLIIATKYNIPFLLHSPGNGAHVKGEIYKVNSKMLTNLDILEDHPKYYEREIDEVEFLNPQTDRTETVKCWIYFLKKYKRELLSRPTLDNYSSKGSHGKPYKERSQRDPSYDYKAEIFEDTNKRF